ncbi:HlyD family efflux transporter periplasmic adaptor subunit [Variovorax sp. GT1P44]|uniref:HlyD family efflux transporter periplasmic adaptor subunit n=1 Tax=Variovorax sp. GT1P44 TaxID=3443742 RepID=UPI003F47B9C1
MKPVDLPRFQDVSWRWVSYTASIVIVVAVAFAFVHEIELKQDVQGEIVSPSDVKIRGLSGLVSAIHVQPSAKVAAGTPLFVLDKNLTLSSDGRQRPQFDEQMRSTQIGTMRTQYEQRRTSLAARLEAARLTQASRQAEMAALDAQGAQNRALVAEAEKKLSPLNSVSDYLPADRIEQARSEMRQSKVVLAQGAARRQQLLGELAASRSTQTELEVQIEALESQHARDVQDLDVRFEESRQRMTISAPKAGVVTFSNLVPGRTLEDGDVALVIRTAEGGPLRAALRIPSRRRGFVHEGQTVRLKFDAFPYERFGSYAARIDSISGTTVQSPAAASGPRMPGVGTDGDDYIAWATLEGDTFNFERRKFMILSGMRATASIVVERRTIAEWVFAPLFRVLRG